MDKIVSLKNYKKNKYAVSFYESEYYEIEAESEEEAVKIALKDWFNKPKRENPFGFCDKIEK